MDCFRPNWRDEFSVCLHLALNDVTICRKKKQKSGNVHMEPGPSSSYQAAETMNTKELEFSQESHAERRENMNPRSYRGGDFSP